MCCGTIIQIGKKTLAIAEGNIFLSVDSFLRLPDQRNPQARSRLAICRACEQHTYLTVTQYAMWMADNGGPVKFAAEIGNLNQWPLLPKQDYTKGGKLFCRICKCWIPAKSHREKETCPIGLWDKS